MCRAAPRRLARLTFTTAAEREREGPTDKEAEMANADDAKGRVKEAAGDLTNDDDLKREGQVDQATGKVKDKIDDASDAIKDRT
jgi:uncharacterized protein YjbJ (UPF0337 family)